jgi:hypothetical protein
MAEKPKKHSPEPRAQERGIEKKVAEAAAKPASPPASGGGARSQTETSVAPQKPKATAQVTPEERWHMISEAAYYRAEKRGFVGGDSAEDWAEAEAQIDAELAKCKT